jgi:hypothetical protein
MEKGSVYNILVGNPNERRPLGRLSFEYEGGFKK